MTTPGNTGVPRVVVACARERGRPVIGPGSREHQAQGRVPPLGCGESCPHVPGPATGPDQRRPPRPETGGPQVALDRCRISGNAPSGIAADEDDVDQE